MKKLLLSCFVLLGLQASAQQTLFEDSFEFYDDFVISGVGEWTLIDVDLLTTYGIQNELLEPYNFPNSGVAKSFQVFNASATVPSLSPGSAANDWTARTGDRHMVCFSGVPTPTVTANNDWLISPAITLGASGNEVSFWAKPCNAQFGAERFRVVVSSTGTTVSDFVTMISPGNFVTTPENTTWVQYTYNIPSSFANMPVYIGIMCISNDQFGFAVDDFKVSGVVLATESFVSQNFNVYPNPASDILNVSAKTNLQINSLQVNDLNGRIVREIGLNETYAQLNIADLTDGIYFLKITSSLGVGIVKIVKN